MRISKILPGSEIGYLVGNGMLGTILRFMARYVPHQAVNASLGLTDLPLVKKVHHDGKRIHVYTVDDENTMRKLFAMGVDGIFTNDPGLPLEVTGSM